jgi:hypothetical protein
MPSYQLRIKCEVNVGASLDEQSADISKVKAIVSAVKTQKFTAQALEALATASGIHIEAKMIGRPAKVLPIVPPPTDPT